MKTSHSAIAGALLLCACATSGVQQETGRQVAQPDTIQAAVLYGEQLNAIYTQQGSRLRSNRTWLGLGILAANTYVTAASGLEAHPDSIFAGALIGNTIRSLDPIINAGGPDAWNAAHARNVCVVAVAGTLNTSSMLTDDALLRANRDDPAQAAAINPVLVRYDGYPARLTSVMREIYGRYLHASTPELPEVNALARGVITQRTEQATQPAAAGAGGAAAGEVEEMSNMAFVERRAALGRQLPLLAGGAVQVTPAIQRMTAALDYADTELPKCRPPAATPPASADRAG